MKTNVSKRHNSLYSHNKTSRQSAQLSTAEKFIMYRFLVPLLLRFGNPANKLGHLFQVLIRQFTQFLRQSKAQRAIIFQTGEKF